MRRLEYNLCYGVSPSSTMKVLSSLGWPAAVIALLTLMPARAFSCEEIPAGQNIWVRLTTPVSTYTAKAGDEVQGVLTEAISCDGETVFPVGAPVAGVVHSVRKVGWGIRHETAALDIRFGAVRASDGTSVPFSAALAEVENARENVSKGVIQGIRSSDTPEGRINSRLRHLPTWNPYSDLGLIVYKAAFPIFPEPEIYLPTGTDVRLKLEEPLVTASLPTSSALPQPQITWAKFDWPDFSQSPTRSTTAAHADADLINLAFVGSREQVEDAFRSAGWLTGDAVTRQTFAHEFYAFLNNSAYTQAPMRPLLLQDNPADMNWQKSLNSYARRDHLRIWSWQDPVSGKTIWLSAATHDSSAALSIKHLHFLHHISPDIDEERAKVIRDLSVAGCVQSVQMLRRDDVPTLSQNDAGDPIRTDGALAIVELKSCQSPAPEAVSAAAKPFRPGNKAFRYVRRQILTFRSDIWRANIIYAAYDLGRMSVTAMKRHNVTTGSRHKDPPPVLSASAH